MKFLTEFFLRLNQESPVFFKKFQNIGKWLTATGLALVGLPAVIEQILPSANFDLSLLLKIASYMVLAGVVIAIVAKAPVDDVKELKEKL